jgi:hypothetical protein
MQTGTVSLNYETHAAEWKLDSGSGERRFRTSIKFPDSFTAPPRVAVALAGVDAGNSANLRVYLTTADVGVDEFDVIVTTWDDSSVYGVNVVWIAE